MSLAFGSGTNTGLAARGTPIAKPPLVHNGGTPKSGSTGRDAGMWVSSGPTGIGAVASGAQAQVAGANKQYPQPSPIDAGALGAALGNSYTGDSATKAEIARLEAQLAAPSFSGGGGGNGAAAAIARRIAALQNQGTDIDIGRMQASMRDIPQLRKDAATQYQAQLHQLQLQAALSKLKSAADARGLTYDATARGAMSSAGYGKGQSDITQALANALSNNAQDRRGVLARRNDTRIDLDTKSRDLYAGVVKLALQKQINDEQAKGAGLGGGGNPMIAYNEFLRKLGLQGEIEAKSAQGAAFDPRKAGTYLEILNNPAYGQAGANIWAQQNGFNLDWLKMFAAPAAQDRVISARDRKNIR